MTKYEKPFWNNNQLVLGIDEAGRGALAGPIFVGGVVLPLNYQNDLIKDSKLLTRNKRKKAFEIIKRDAIFYFIDIASVEEVEKYNPAYATKRVMEKIIIGAKSKQIEHVLIDFVKFDDDHIISLTKGELKSISIAATSIVAKEARDLYMEKMDLKYPNYLFKKHKGYGTKEHYQILQEKEPSEIHRKTFRLK